MYVCIYLFTYLYLYLGYLGPLTYFLPSCAVLPMGGIITYLFDQRWVIKLLVNGIGYSNIIIKTYIRKKYNYMLIWAHQKQSVCTCLLVFCLEKKVFGFTFVKNTFVWCGYIFYQQGKKGCSRAINCPITYRTTTKNAPKWMFKPHRLISLTLLNGSTGKLHHIYLV